MESLEIPAPDGSHLVRLEYASEIRFGPAYYRAFLDGRELPERFFGALAAWSPDAAYCALQLWNTTREQDGPDTSLFLIRLTDLRYTDRPRVRHGWLRDLRFEGRTVRYSKDLGVRAGRIERFELDPADVTDWRELFPTRPNRTGPSAKEGIP